MKYLILVLSLLSPFAAQAARVTCEDFEQAMDVPDDRCEGIERSAMRCFRSLNKEYADSRHIKNREERGRVKSELAADYEREILGWKKNIVALSQFGEGQACTDQVGSVGIWIDEMEKDLMALRRR